jgi:transposase
MGDNTMKRTSMKKIREIIKLYSTTDFSIRKIARAASVSRPVVKEYLDSFENCGLTYEEISNLNDDDLLVIIRKKVVTKNDRYAYLASKFEYFSQELKKKYVTIQKLWEEYIEETPDGFSRSQFCFHFHSWRKQSELTMHIEHKAGDKMFVDFTGKKLHITNKETGEIQDAETFVAILPASQLTFVCATENQKTCNWIKGSQEAFWYFGGTTEAIVPDCFKSAVNRPCRYEPEINPEYERFANHYNTVILPARPMHPDDKALVENAVKIVYAWIYAALRDQVFYSVTELNKAIFKELEKYNSKKMQKPGISRLESFNNIEKNSLGSLPLDLYESKTCRKATIQSNYHVVLSEDKHYYSVPYSYYSKSALDKKTKAELLYTDETVEIYYKNERIASHRRDKSRNGYTTKPEHMPESHRTYLERWNPEKMILLAKQKGKNVSLLIEKIIGKHKHPEQSYNTCRGIIFLAKTYGDERLNKACSKAIYFNMCSYRSVKEILDTNSEDYEEEPGLFESTMDHSNIRGEEYYKNKIMEAAIQ